MSKPERELSPALRAAIGKIPVPPRAKSENQGPTIAEQVKSLHDTCASLMEQLGKRHSPALLRLVRDAQAMRGIDPEGAFYPFEEGEVLAPCPHMIALKQATERLLKSDDMKGTHRDQRHRAHEMYALKLAGCFLDNAVDPKTTKTGLYVRTLAERLNVSESTAAALANRAIRRAKGIR